MTAAIGHYTPVRMSTVEFEVCWEGQGLGELPPVLDLPSPGRTHEERRQLVQQVQDRLRGYGLADARGLHSDLTGMLATLRRCAWAVDAWLALDTSVRIRGAAAGPAGVVAMLHEETVMLWGLPADAVLNEVVAQLPEAPVPSRRVGSISLPAATLDAALAAVGGHDAIALADELTRQGERPANARAVAGLVENAGYHGQFTVTVADSRGNRHATPRVVGFHDTPTARIMHLRRGDWVSFAPVNHSALAHAVRELLDETRDRLS